ncbi:MAG TPA: CRISPR-associated endonuclease Cas2 [Armatimonadetes bacterium]|nr:CRISPR-associated endonuclease Cas2 [Armatimonadota bacterium]
MYVIIVYDVDQKRVQRVCNFLRRFLNWVQNSVFEGELTESQLARVKEGLSRRINEEEDSVYIYIFSDKKWVKREVVGQVKMPIDSVI